ncbi:MAG TPA: J domain-containing protein [Candidatus Nitrosotalea sp.]|nr:J domain-containing protein [Candidatus Nitrosotalea sp.]
MKEAFPLSWPDGWVRTRPQYRRGNNTWKKTFGIYRDDLIDEVERLKATSLVISTNIPLTLKGLPREGYAPPDPGVAVYFGRRQREDRTWFDVLEITGVPEVRPSDPEHCARVLKMIDEQFRKFSKKYHPDVGGDLVLFQQLVKARDAGRDFYNGLRRADHEYVLACDLFNEVRLNMHAIALTVQAMRQIERCGASSMLERAFRGFMAALPARGETS